MILLIVTFAEHMPSSILRSLHIVTHLASQQPSGKGAIITPILAKEETETQRGYITCLRSHGLAPEPQRLLSGSNDMVHINFWYGMSRTEQKPIHG